MLYSANTWSYGSGINLTADSGNKYTFKLIDDIDLSGYATCLITDEQTHDQYITEGVIELGIDIITTKWGRLGPNGYKNLIIEIVSKNSNTGTVKII